MSVSLDKSSVKPRGLEKLKMQRREHLSLSPSQSSMENDDSQNVGKEWENAKDNDIEMMNPLFARPVAAAASTKNTVSQISIDKYREEMRQRRITAGGTSRHIIDRLQGIYLSKKFSSYIPVSTDESDESSAIHPSGRIPLVKGLDRVVNGTKPAADVVVICGIKPLRYLWYMLSGGTS